MATRQVYLGFTLTLTKLARTPKPVNPAAMKEAEAATVIADTLRTVPTLTSMLATTAAVITFCCSCSKERGHSILPEGRQFLQRGVNLSAEQYSIFQKVNWLSPESYLLDKTKRVAPNAINESKDSMCLELLKFFMCLE